MIHEFATLLGTSDNIIVAVIISMGTIVVAILSLIGIVIKNGKDVRIVRDKVTSNIEEKRHQQNTRRFIKLENGQAEDHKAIIKIQDHLGIERTIVPVRKRK